MQFQLSSVNRLKGKPKTDGHDETIRVKNPKKEEERKKTYVSLNVDNVI